jgi:hypothetical protein
MMEAPVDIVSGLLGLMWAALAAAIVGYAMRRIVAGRNAVVLVTAVAALAFAAGYLAHRTAMARGAEVPRNAALDAQIVNAASIDVVAALGSIDRVTASAHPISVVVAGWAADGLRYRPGAGVFAIVDGRSRAIGTPATYGIDRPDVAHTFNDANLLWTGFQLTFFPDALPAGPHYLQIALLASDLKHAYVMAKRVAFTVP